MSQDQDHQAMKAVMLPVLDLAIKDAIAHQDVPGNVKEPWRFPAHHLEQRLFQEATELRFASTKQNRMEELLHVINLAMWEYINLQLFDGMASIVQDPAALGHKAAMAIRDAEDDLGGNTLR